MNDTMTVPEKVLAELLGRDVTADEMGKLYRIKEHLQLGDHDAIWTLLTAFHCYDSMYQEMPEKIRAALLTILAEFKVSVNAVSEAAERQTMNRIEASAAEAVNRLLEKTREGAHALNTATYKSRMIVIAAVATITASLGFFAVGWAGYVLAERATAGDAAWLSTPEGRAARRFAALNSVERMMECNEPLQRQQHASGLYCLPYDATRKEVRMYRIK